jgi:hypothetical protein
MVVSLMCAARLIAVVYAEHWTPLQQGRQVGVGESGAGVRVVEPTENAARARVRAISIPILLVIFVGLLSARYSALLCAVCL